jgi:WNK lysine deficient protein kinase
MAPELYSGEYDKRVDIYAFGMCLLSILANEEPYSECNNIMQIYKKVMNKIPPESLNKIEDDKIKDLILKLIGEKETRLTIYEIKIYFDKFLY